MTEPSREEIARLCIKPKDDGESVDGFETMKAIADALAAKDATITALRAEVEKWKASHDEMVRRNRELRDRPDLGDRAKSIDDLRSTIARLEAEVEKNKDRAQWYDRTLTDLAKMCGKSEPTTHGLDYTTIIGAKLSKLEAENAGLRKACKLAQSAMGMHGPCKNNSCRDCRSAWEAIKKALATDAAGWLKPKEAPCPGTPQ